MNMHMVLWINSLDKQKLHSTEGGLINVKRVFRCATAQLDHLDSSTSPLGFKPLPHTKLNIIMYIFE